MNPNSELRGILDGLIYGKCCKTINKEKFQPYEKYIDQTLTAIETLFDKRIEQMREKLPEKKVYGEYAGAGFNDCLFQVHQIINEAIGTK